MILGPAQVLTFGTTTVDVLPYKGAAILLGWAFKETTNGAPATFNVCDGNGGATIVPITLATNESIRDWLGGFGILVRQGLYLDVLSGSVSGTFWIRPLPTDDDGPELDVHSVIDQIAALLHGIRYG